jgi:hypothetical protein
MMILLSVASLLENGGLRCSGVCFRFRFLVCNQ